MSALIASTSPPIFSRHYRIICYRLPYPPKKMAQNPPTNLRVLQILDTSQSMGIVAGNHVTIRRFWVNYVKGKQFEPNIKAGTFKRLRLEKT